MKILLLSILCFLVTSSINSQSSLDSLVFDMDAMKFDIASIERLDNLSTGDYFQIKIKGLNQNLYQVKIELGDSTYFSPIKVPSFTDLSVGSVEDMLSIFDIPILTNPIDSLNQIKYFASSQYTGQAPATVAHQPSFKDTCYSLQAAQKYRLDSSALELKNIDLKVKGVQDSLNLYRLKSALLNKSYSSISIDLFEKSLNDFAELRSAVVKLQEETLDFLYNDEKLSGCLLHFQTDSLFSIKSNQGELKKVAFTKAGDSLIRTLSPNKIIDYLMPFVTIANNSSREYTSMPFRMKSDMVDIKLSIIPKDSADLPSYHTSLFFPEAKESLIKSGTLFYLGWADNDDVSFRQMDNDNFEVVDERASKFEYGVGLPIYYRFDEDVDKDGHHVFIAPALGISDKVRPRLMAGVGWHSSGIHAITVNASIIVGQFDKRTALLDDIDIEGITNIPDPAIVSPVDVRFALSFGYLFNGKVTF